MEKILRNILILALAVLISVSLFFAGRNVFSRPDVYRNTIASIDEKVETVMKLSATSTIASAGISMIPDDTATPIAAKLADFTEYFMLILCVLYTEKYLLTVIGSAAFQYLFPAAILLGAWGWIRSSKGMNRCAVKLGAVTLAFVLVIPMSIRISDMIYATYRESIDSTISGAEELGEQDQPEAETAGIGGMLTRLWENTTDLTNKAAHTMNGFVESLAVMIVTSCVIPVVVLLFFIWLIKLITGIDLPNTPRRKSLPQAET